MDYNRAQQILSSEQTIEVLYEGNPVWIESLKQGEKTAKIKFLRGAGAVKEVSVADLVEL